MLAAEINDELAKLEKLANRLATQQGRVDDEEISESAALRLHNFYTGELKPERVEELVKLTLALYPRFAKEIGVFTAFLMDVFNQA